MSSSEPYRETCKGDHHGGEQGQGRAQRARARPLNRATWLLPSSDCPTYRRSKKVYNRVERVASAAESDQQCVAVASLSGQQLRAAEVRAKLGGAGGYGTPRNDKGNAAPFVLNINLSGGRTARIEGVPIHPDDPAFNALPTAPLSIGRASPAHGGGMSQGEPSDDEAMFDEDV